MKLDVHRLDADGLRDSEGVFPAAHGISPSGAVMIRPDGFVGWRADAGGASPAEEIVAVLRTLTCRARA
jgi:putative polyketide hydroxylase